MMPRFSLEWHRTRLANWECLLKDRGEELSVLLAVINMLRDQITFSRAQIEEAEKRGVEGYDAERFMVKHPLKHTVVAVKGEGE